MPSGGAARRGRRWPLYGAAAATIAAAVVSDTVLGERPVHSALLAAVLVLVFVVRVRLTRRCQGLIVVMGGAVVAQPAIHVGSKVSDALHSSGGHQHVGALGFDVTTGLVHLLVALTLVVIVSVAEQVLQLVARSLRQLVRLFQLPVAVRDGFAADPATAPLFAPVYRLWARHMGRRGPPAGWFAAA